MIGTIYHAHIPSSRHSKDFCLFYEDRAIFFRLGDDSPNHVTLEDALKEYPDRKITLTSTEYIMSFPGRDIVFRKIHNGIVPSTDMDTLEVFITDNYPELFL